MSVLIKTMTNLPEHCYDCPCHNRESGYCQADKEYKYSVDRPFWCPLLKISNADMEDVLDKIRAEIQSLSNANPSYWHSGDMVDRNDVFEIIDKYKVESEG